MAGPPPYSLRRLGVAEAGEVAVWRVASEPSESYEEPDELRMVFDLVVADVAGESLDVAGAEFDRLGGVFVVEVFVEDVGELDCGRSGLVEVGVAGVVAEAPVDGQDKV